MKLMSLNRVGFLWMIKRVQEDGRDIDEAREEAEAIGRTQVSNEGVRRRVHQVAEMSRHEFRRTASATGKNMALLVFAHPPYHTLP